MKTDNPTLYFCSALLAAMKRSASPLLAVILLFANTTNLLANNDSEKNISEKNRWALNSTLLAMQSEPAETISKSEFKNQLRLKAIPEETLKSESLDPSQAIEPEDKLSGYDITEGAAPLDIPLANVKTVLTLSPELRESLKLQFQQIQTLKETEEAFSEQLGESYLGYGRTLMRAGRIEESRKMLVNALHIAKINNGVTSIEQRPILRELFEMNLALGNTEEMTEQISRIVWLEKKNPQIKDVYSFDMVVRLGNHYLDLFINAPVISELSLDRLNKSSKYLGYAINRYGDRPLSEILLPYGELALVYFEQSRVRREVDRSFYRDTRQRNFNDPNRLNRLQGRKTNINSFSRSERTLKNYLAKAKQERDLINTIHALLGLGDLNLLTGRVTGSKKYFDLAWSGAQNLPLNHPIVKSFNSPVKLPSFNFSVVRKPPLQTKETEMVALSIKIDDDGVVRKVESDALVEADKWTTTRARRQVKGYKFRPIIDNGKLVASTAYRYEVEVVSRKSKAIASKDNLPE